MYKLCLLIAATSALNMMDVIIPGPSSSTILPPCVEDATKSTCHFEGTKNICACPALKKQIVVGKCVPMNGPTGSKACYIEESLAKEFREECPCPAVPEKKLVEEKRNPAVSLGMSRF